MPKFMYMDKEYSGSGATTAKQLDYDNTKSELESTNTQDAIDELKELSDIKLDLNSGDTKNNVTTFTSGDSTSPTTWTDVSTLSSGLTHANIFNKISTMFKNVRYLYKLLGTTDVSSLSTEGTVTAGLSALNTKIPKIVSAMPDNYTGNYGSRENVLVYSVVYKDFVEIHIKGIFEGVTDLLFADMNIGDLTPNVALYGEMHALGVVDGYDTGKLVVVGYLGGKSLQINASAKDTYNITLCIGILE